MCPRVSLRLCKIQMFNVLVFYVYHDCCNNLQAAAIMLYTQVSLGG